MRFFAENNRPGFEYPPAGSFSLVGHWLQTLRTNLLLKKRKIRRRGKLGQLHRLSCHSDELRWWRCTVLIGGSSKPAFEVRGGV